MRPDKYLCTLFLLFAAALFLALPLTASADFSSYFGGISGEYGNNVYPTADGGFLLLGSTNTYGAGGDDMYLVKTDASGVEQWYKTYGDGANLETGYSIAPTADGGFLLLGKVVPMVTGITYMYLVKVDANGNMLWTKTYGSAMNSVGRFIYPAPDGSFLLLGYTGTADYDVYLVNIDANGNEQWYKTYGDAVSYEYGYSLCPTSDGGYALVGTQDNMNASAPQAYLVRIDVNGNMQWTKTYGGSGQDSGRAILLAPDGGFYLLGRTDSFGNGNYDMYLVKTDSSGNELWYKTYGTQHGDNGMDMLFMPDGGLMLLGHADNGIEFITIAPAVFTDDGLYLVRVDSAGTELWSTSYGTTGYEYGNSIKETADGYVMLGSANNSSAGMLDDMYLIKAETHTYYRDADGDGYGDPNDTVVDILPHPGYISSGGDCDDNNVDTNPSAVDAPDDGIDQDCNGVDTVTYYRDADGDGYGDPGNSLTSSSQPTGFVPDNTDCDDNDSAVNPGATEIANDGIDQDCSGSDLVVADDHGDDYTNATALIPGTPVAGDISETGDEDWFTFTAGAGTPYTIGTSQSALSIQAQALLFSSAPSPDTKLYLYDTDGVTELASDDDGGEGLAAKIEWTCPADGDYYIKVIGFPGTYFLQLNDTADSDGDGYTTAQGDCDDTDSAVNPGADEVCGDSIDNNCDGTVDEGCDDTADSDGDGYTTAQGDCDDTDSAVNPGADEVCGDSIDNNCDGVLDEGCNADGEPETVTISYSYTGGPANYQMVSFPMVLDDVNAVNNLGPLFNQGDSQTTYDPEIWRIYCYKGGDYRQPPDECTQLNPGKGFWIVSLNDATISLTGTAVDQTADYDVTIPDGWSMIGNPFDFHVNVDGITVVSSGGGEVALGSENNALTLPDLYYWDAGISDYIVVTQLSPNKGYWIKNKSGGELTIKIPPAEVAAADRSALVRAASTSEAPPMPPVSGGGSDVNVESGGCFIAEASYTTDVDNRLLRKLFEIIDSL